MANGATVSCVGVTKTHRSGSREVHAVRDVDLEVAAGSWVALTGASGSGKSTLLQLLGGLDRPDRGTISIGGQRIDDLSETARSVMRRRKVGYIFQFFNLVTNLSVGENVELPLLLAGASRREATTRRDDLLCALGLDGLARAATSELSGGQQQRVAIARALANGPDVLLADEPTGNLDRASTAEVLAVLQGQHLAGQTIVMVTHDAEVAGAGDRVLVMADGQIVDDRRT